ncbi:S-layer homology domain-containing protein [Paenibacillus paridis]|uniref:S-layer homology domain-containing protein n=1 Tax=Paenibacillus paridis TaxID=2583376 RepID=UPI001EE476BF|nr:S-layer homology domain-containing protein [Paenibacillus paridis]
MKRAYHRFAMVTIALLTVFTTMGKPVDSLSSLPFDDIGNSYAKQEIIDLYNRKIITGTTERSFSPAQSISRAEFVAIIDRLLGLEPVTSPVSPFADVPKQAWHYGWIQAAVQLGLADGTSATAFAPSMPVTRQEAAVLLARALKQAGSKAEASLAFGDSSQIASWASASVAAVHKLGLIKGDEQGDFRPTKPITRQETAVMIYRVLQNKTWEAELKAAPTESIKLGWQYGQTTKEYQNNVLKSNVNTLSPRWYFTDALGNIVDNTDSSLLTWAKQHNKKVWAMVGNRSDQAATHQMLSSSAARSNAVTKLVAYAKSYKLDGLNIDFENVAPQDRAALTAFMTELAKKLKLLSVTLSIDVSPDRGTDWTDAFDFAALGKLVDYVVLMGYDEHWGGSSEAGSNASLGFDKAALDKLLKHVAGGKIILAVPLYNRDWDLNKDGSVASTEFISLTQQNALMAQFAIKPVWDAKIGQYTAAYLKNGVRHRMWLEDGRSLTAKYKLVVDAELAGLAYWYVGGESADIWSSMRNADRFLNYTFSS